MQGQFALGQWGVHTGGHFTIGGDPRGVSSLIESVIVHRMTSGDKGLLYEPW